MSDRNYELELYQLITDEEYVDELGWVTDNEFCVWVKYVWMHVFMERLTEIFGYGIFDDGAFNANMQSDSTCIVLNDVLCGYGVDFEEVFPKDKYTH